MYLITQRGIDEDSFTTFRKGTDLNVEDVYYWLDRQYMKGVLPVLSIPHFLRRKRPEGEVRKVRTFEVRRHIKSQRDRS